MLGDGAGKKGSRKGMYNVTRVRYIRAFFTRKYQRGFKGSAKIAGVVGSLNCWELEYLGISNNLVALNVLLMPIVVLNVLVNTPIALVHPHRSAEKVVKIALCG